VRALFFQPRFVFALFAPSVRDHPNLLLLMIRIQTIAIIIQPIRPGLKDVFLLLLFDDPRERSGEEIHQK
jgi:hypothetical protein